MSRRRNTAVDLTVIILLIFAGLMAFYLYSTAFTMKVPNEVKTASAYETEETRATFKDNLDVLNDRTDILGQTAYSQDGEVLGMMYDAYVDAETGEIRWVSINLNGDNDSPLVMISAKLVESFGDQGPAIINLSKERLLEYPMQQKYEEKLAGHISVRALPGTFFNDSKRTYSGDITHVTYSSGKIDQVFMNIATSLGGKEDHLFAFDFEDIAFTLSDEYYNKEAGVTLTDTQIGAILAFVEADKQ